jgi:hypothetical protein
MVALLLDQKTDCSLVTLPIISSSSAYSSLSLVLRHEAASSEDKKANQSINLQPVSNIDD